MIEILPQFVYTPNGVLSLRTEFHEDPNIQIRQLKILEHLAESPGTIVDGSNTVHVNVKQALGSNFGYTREGAVGDFLSTIGRVLPGYPTNPLDRVVSPQWVSPEGLSAVVYTHFQRWLNTQSPLDEHVAREAVLAMAVPFGKEKEREAKRDFQMFGRAASATFFDVKVFDDRFGISAIEETEDGHEVKAGRVTWNWVDLSTLGSCACFGVTGDERQRINVSTDAHLPWLYEMTPHNIDFPQQTLSLLLGIGALSYRAAQYAGQEDILADAEWSEPRIYPKVE